jgi:hypothetical protein
MKKEEKIGLSEAIKQHYRAEPLNIRLPVTVANRVFGKKTSSAGDTWLYVLAAACGLAILFICVLSLAQWLFNPGMIGVGILMAAFLWLSYQEFLIWLDGGCLHEKTLTYGK